MAFFMSRLLVLGLVASSGLSFQYIYISIDPGERGEVEVPGLYGGLLNTSDLGEATNLYQAGFNCMKFQDSNQISWVRGLNILSTNYDPISDTILLQAVSESGRNHVTLGMGYLCGYVDCEAWPLTSHLLDVNSLSQTIGPMAYFDSEIYFISKYQQAGNSVNYEIVELRKAETCNTMFPIKGKSLDFDLCSSQIALILNATVPFDQSIHYYAGNSMYKIVSSSSLMFFIQIFKVVNDEIVEVSLYDVSAFTQQPYMLYQETDLDVKPPGSLLATSGGLGGSGFKDNRLCWTTLQQVHCAWWSAHGEDVQDFRTVLNASEVGSFCGDDHGNRDWLVRDVSLADTFHPFDEGRELFLYFSCLNMNTGGSGQTGLLRMTETDEKWFYPVTSNGQPVHAGGLFLQRQPSRNCPLTRPTVPGGGNGRPTPPENIGNVVKSSMFVMAIGLLIQIALYIYMNYRHGSILTSTNLGQRGGTPPDIHLN